MTFIGACGKDILESLIAYFRFATIYAKDNTVAVTVVDKVYIFNHGFPMTSYPIIGFQSI